jgi:hypothetical protein
MSIDHHISEPTGPEREAMERLEKAGVVASVNTVTMTVVVLSSDSFIDETLLRKGLGKLFVDISDEHWQIFMQKNVQNDKPSHMPTPQELDKYSEKFRQRQQTLMRNLFGIEQEDASLKVRNTQMDSAEKEMQAESLLGKLRKEKEDKWLKNL